MTDKVNKIDKINLSRTLVQGDGGWVSSKAHRGRGVKQAVNIGVRTFWIVPSITFLPDSTVGWREAYIIDWPGDKS